MADYRFAAQVISRKDGRSATASAAYRSASVIADERTGEIHDYTRKRGVEWSGIMAPDNVPAWAQERDKLWNMVEQKEKRHDAQVAREVQLSLPHELNFEQRRALVCAFVQQEFVARGMVADIAMHLPDRRGDQRNFHAHVMLTMRDIGPEGFGKKNRNWNSREELAAMREAWANIQNAHLRQHLGPDAPQVSHLSYAERGVDKVATTHLGPTATGMERQGIQTMLGDRNREAARRNQTIRQSRQRMAEIANTVERRTQRSFGFVAMEARLEARKRIDEKRQAEQELQNILARKAHLGPAPSRRALRDEVLKETRAEIRALQRRLKSTTARGRSLTQKAKSISRWITNPARMIWLKIATLHAEDRVRADLKRAQMRLEVRREWLASAEGRAWADGKSKSTERGTLRTDERRARRHIRTAERRIAQAQTLGRHAEALGALARSGAPIPPGVELPEKPLDPKTYLAQMSAQVQSTVRSLSEDLRAKLIQRMTRGRGVAD